ncbi:MAG: CoB--CoM heterodisulfide reductase iron-sulfur subunit B family protein, partial [Candidatus Hydrothermarchaeaceae archaeon]
RAEHDMFMQSLGAALQNLLLAANAYGLAGYLKGAPLICQTAVAEALGIQLVDLEAATCCGAGVMEEIDENLNLALNARIFALAQEKGLNEIVVICCTCLLYMRKANRMLKDDPDALARVNEMLSEVGLRYDGKLEVRHFIWALEEDYAFENIRKKVNTPLGLKVAPFYGCHYLRPGWILGHDDPERPNSLDAMISALGGVPVDYEGRTRCCGFHSSLVRERVSLDLVGGFIANAKESGAELMVTPCTLCHVSLDAFQPKAEKRKKTYLRMPVFNATQLIGLALGIDGGKLGLSRHIVPIPGLRKTG